MASGGFKSRRIFLISIITLVVIILIGVAIYFGFFQNSSNGNDQNEKEIQPKKILWHYKCENNLCMRQKLNEFDDNSTLLSGLSHCRVICGSNNQTGLLWPLPQKVTAFDSSKTQTIDINKISVSSDNFTADSRLWDAAKLRFDQIISKKKSGKFLRQKCSTCSSAVINVKVTVVNDARKFDYDTDESYKIEFSKLTFVEIGISVVAKTFYGARHGLETLTQLIYYEEIAQEFRINLVEIEDWPKFKHRGVSVDTSRNFQPVEVLKRNINAMAMVKMNRFHWHISDSQSFPLLLESHPDLALNSAYSIDKIYTTEDVKDLIEYGKSRGVQVFIEIDVPAHIGEGFHHKNLTSCYGHTLTDYCKASKSCGQLDPSNDEVYKVLFDIYKEIYDLHDGEIDIVHQGGDEIFFECWAESKKLLNLMAQNGWELNEEGYMEVWGHFLKKSLESLDRANGDKKFPIILFSSSLTQLPYLTKYLDKDRMIIEMWTTKTSTDIRDVLENGFQIIISNNDVLYLDCGFGTFIRDSLSWCGPYHTWINVYENRLEEISGEEYLGQVLGAEAAIWSEMISQFELDSRIWPRLSALAERLWSDPKTGYRAAEARMLYHREQLVEIGDVQAAAIQPEWCYQNEGICPK